MSEYVTRQHLRRMPRVPLRGCLDLTYRCNNVCRHCWLWLPDSAAERGRELSFDEIVRIAGEARALGCREWSISGGEPMLRPDFVEIFDYLTRGAATYSLNSNGTLITPGIARLLKRKGNKMIALYGATAATYDRVTRHPGGFEQALAGLRYLQEAGAGFTVQLIPMRENWHEWDKMQALAGELSPHVRVGAAWLYLSACGGPARNAEIAAQRLAPRNVVALDLPDMSSAPDGDGHDYHRMAGDDRLFAACIEERRDFHIDPYGGMTFCSYVKDPALRYDLRAGTFQEAWDRFIPSLADRVHGGREYTEGCAACDLRADCRWCPVYGYLEHGRFSASVEYLCEVARDNRRVKETWQCEHRRYYEIAGITLQVDSDLPITDATYTGQVEQFRVAGPGPDTVTIRHHFELPDLQGQDLGREVYRKAPWAIYRRGDAWLYLGVAPDGGPPHHMVATFSHDHARARIYHDGARVWDMGGHNSLTLFPSDQILVARLLAERDGCYLHSAGAILDGAGLLFVGHSEAGKSTTTRLLMEAFPPAAPSAGGNGSGGERRLEILCDDRNIVRHFALPAAGESLGGATWRVYGTWSHGDVPVVSPSSAPLRAVCFIEQAGENTLTRLHDRKDITRRLLACVIRSLVTADWWDKTLSLVERMAAEVPCYVMRFDKSGAIVRDLARLASRPS